MAERAHSLVLYTRFGCSLCEQFHAALAAWCGTQSDLELRVVDVDFDALAEARFGAHVPLVCGDEGDLCRVRFEAWRMDAWLERRRAAQPVVMRSTIG